MKALAQDVLEEAADEFLTGNTAGAPSRGFALLIVDRYGVLIEADDAAVGDGDAKDVASKVIEHRRLAARP